MWTAMLHRFPHPCAVVDVLADVWDGAGINMFAETLVDVNVIAVSSAAIALEFDRALQARIPSYHV